MTPHAWLAEFSSWLWPLVANHLWQATLFTGVAFVAALALRRCPARARRMVWLIALAKFALPSAVLVTLVAAAGFRPAGVAPSPSSETLSPVLVRLAQPVFPGAAAAGLGAAPAQDHNELYCLLTGIWLSGCVAMLAWWWKRRRRLSTAVRAAKPLLAGRELEALERARSRLRLRRRVRLLISCRIADPGVWGVSKPVVVLPAGIAAELSGAELEALLTHELFHVRNRDNLAGTLQTLLCSVFWFHPLVWWIGRRLLAERERACDEAVLAAIRDSDSYLAGILKVCRFSIGPSVAGVSGMAGSNLKRRMEWIMSNNVRNGSAAFRRSILTATGAAFVVFSLAAGTLSGGRAIAQTTKAAAQEPRGVPGGVKGGVGRGVGGGVSGGVADGVTAQPSRIPVPYSKWIEEDVVYVIGQGERAAFLRLSTDQQREQFIERFWRDRDPTPGTSANEFKEEHYRRIQYANERFASTALAGWKTPRGRIYIVYGPADEVESHPSQNIERWRYRSGPLADVVLEFRLP